MNSADRSPARIQVPESLGEHPEQGKSGTERLIRIKVPIFRPIDRVQSRNALFTAE